MIFYALFNAARISFFAFYLVLLAKIREKNKDVGQFFFYVLEFFFGEIAGLLGSLPEEVFFTPLEVQNGPVAAMNSFAL